jgi:hypothetical protein
VWKIFEIFNLIPVKFGLKKALILYNLMQIGHKFFEEKNLKYLYFFSASGGEGKNDKKEEDAGIGILADMLDNLVSNFTNFFSLSLATRTSKLERLSTARNFSLTWSQAYKTLSFL